MPHLFLNVLIFFFAVINLGCMRNLRDEGGPYYFLSPLRWCDPALENLPLSKPEDKISNCIAVPAVYYNAAEDFTRIQSVAMYLSIPHAHKLEQQKINAPASGFQ